MTSKPTLRAKPPSLRNSADLNDPKLSEFLGGADQDSPASASQSSTDAAPDLQQEETPLPWEDPSVRLDVNKLYNLRLPEPYLLKLRYIAEHTPHSMHRFCLDTLLPAIDAKIAEITRQR